MHPVYFQVTQPLLVAAILHFHKERLFTDQSYCLRSVVQLIAPQSYKLATTVQKAVQIYSCTNITLYKCTVLHNNLASIEWTLSNFKIIPASRKFCFFFSINKLNSIS